MKVTLTFDNGPDPKGTTAWVLDVLRDHDVLTSFFVTGRQLELPGSRALAECAREAGHWIGNHTFSHSVQFGESDDTALPEREIGTTQALIGDLSHPLRFFRPYAGGEISSSLLSDAAIGYLSHGGYSMALWNSVPRDWEGGRGWIDRCLDDVLDQDWSVVVLHDWPTGAMQHLPELLNRLDRAGVEIVQEIAPDCLPIRAGQVTGDLTSMTTAFDGLSRPRA
jgi:peptidoglycan/xylan/chitin deacetylase (PgdA/CDA1 family)